MTQKKHKSWLFDRIIKHFVKNLLLQNLTQDGYGGLLIKKKIINE
jgi:hypothetical protein